MMYQKFPIGDKELMFCCCASVNVCYFEIFKEDFIKMIADDGLATSAMMKMAFVMNKYGELNDRKAVMRQTMDDYCDWLDQFTTGQLADALPAIQTFYLKSNVESVDSKKNSVEQNAQ